MSPIISARALAHAYRSGDVETPVLRGVDLDIDEGAFAVVAGPSGSGKSTLLNLIGALDTADSGTLTVCEVPLHGASEAERHAFRRDHIAWVFQFFHLLPVLSARENIQVILEGTGVSRRDARTRADEALEAVGLGDKATRLPAQLSGGEQQRVGLARALAKRPRLILADEPTGALDRALATDIIGVLQALRARQETTLVVVTHDPQLMAVATDLFEIADGRVQVASP